MKKNILKLKEDLFAYILLFSGFIIRLLYIFIFTKPENYLWSDAGTYDEHAMRMAKDIHITLSTYWPPFFHMFLSLIYRPLIWLGLENWRININVILFALFYIIAFWCIYQIVKKLFTKKAGLIVLGVLILWYPFIFLNALVMSENLFFVLVFLGLYFLIIKQPTTLNGFWLGLFWGLAVITRPIFAFTLPFFIFWGLYYKINWKFLLSTTIAASVIIFSLMTFNYFYTGGAEKSVSSSGGFNFAMTWCDVKSVKYTHNGYWFWFVSAANIDYPDDKAIVTDVPFENQNYYYQIGLDCIKEHPEAIINNLSSIKKLFSSHLFPTTTDMAGWQNFRLIFKIITGLLFAASLATIIGLFNGWTYINKETKKYLFLFAIIILSLFITLYFQNVGEERYLIPYCPFLIMLAIPTLTKLTNYLKRNKISSLVSIRPYWIWPCYVGFVILSLWILWISSVSLKTSYLIDTNQTRTAIKLPFQKEDPKFKDPHPSYKIILNSKIKQSAKIGIAVDDTIDKITVNGQPVDLNPTKKYYDKNLLDNWKAGYNFIIPLNAGENNIYIESTNTECCGSGIKLKQKPFLWIWILLFISIGLPLAHIFTILVEIIFRKKTAYDNKKQK